MRARAPRPPAAAGMVRPAWGSLTPRSISIVLPARPASGRGRACRLVQRSCYVRYNDRSTRGAEMTETVGYGDALRPLRAKTALVTGGGRGLGAAISRRLDQAGARIAVVGRDKPALDAVVSELQNDAIAV